MADVDIAQEVKTVIANAQPDAPATALQRGRLVLSSQGVNNYAPVGRPGGCTGITTGIRLSFIGMTYIKQSGAACSDSAARRSGGGR